MLDEVFEKLDRMVVFRLPVFGREIEISNSLCITWLMMVVLIVLVIVFTRRLSVVKPSKRQILAEWLFGNILAGFIIVELILALLLETGGPDFGRAPETRGAVLGGCRDGPGGS